MPKPKSGRVRLALDVDEDLRDALRLAAAESRERMRDTLQRFLRAALGEQLERLHQAKKES